MNTNQFDRALVIAYKKAIKVYGADHAGSAILSAVERGAESFEDADKLLHYVFSCARGDRITSHEKDKRYKEVIHEAYKERNEVVDEATDEWSLDVSSAVNGIDASLKDAVEAYLLHGETMTSASKYITADVGRTTKYYWLKQTIEELRKGKLKDYVD